MAEVDARRFAPATARNRAPILAVLERVLPARGLLLEIASGTGEHAVAFARALPGLAFQPSDADPEEPHGDHGQSAEIAHRARLYIDWNRRAGDPDRDRPRSRVGEAPT